MKRIFSILVALILVITAIPFLGEESFALGLTETKTQYYVEFDPGSGDGRSFIDGPYELGESITLPSVEGCGFEREGYYCVGWAISGKNYAEGASYTNKGSGSTYKDQYIVTAKAQWAKDGSASSSSSSKDDDDDDSSSSTSSSKIIIEVTYDPGKAGGLVHSEFYNGEFTLPECSYKYEGHKFVGWKCSADGNTYEPGTRVTSKTSMEVTFTAMWEEGTASSSVSSSAPSSSAPSSSVTSSPKPSSSSAPSSSAPSSSSSSEESSEPESSESSSSVEEVPERFEPITLAFSIDGDIPVTKIEFVLEEDIGETPTLNIIPIDSYSVTDAAAEKFIADGDALAAFDLSLLSDGKAYNGAASGTVKFHLNGTQASAVSSYDSYVLAMVHTVNIGKYDGDYYMTDGENTYLYTPETDFRSAVANVKLVEEDDVYRLVIKDVSGLSSFAYKASEDTVVEVNLVPSRDAESASIDVDSLSPLLLVQIEVGEGKSTGGIPLWVWIVIAAVVLVIGVLVALFLINRSNEQKRTSYASERRSSSAQSTSSGITGFDDEE